MISSTASSVSVMSVRPGCQVGAPARQRVLDERGGATPLAGSEKAAEDERAAVRGDDQPVAVVVPLLEDDAEPIGLEAPRPALAAHAEPIDGQRIADETDA